MPAGDIDFNINIRTIADTTGIKLTQQQLDALKVSAIQGNQQAIQALSQLTNAQRQAAGAGAENARQLGSLLGSFTGVGLGAGIYQFVNGLKQASAEIAKVADALDKQGAQLVESAQHLGEQARLAKDEADVLKISDATLKEIATTQKTYKDLSQQELSITAKISDELQKQMLARQRAAGMGDYEAAQQANLKTALDQLQTARQKGMDEVLAAEAAANQTYDEQLETLNNLISAEEKHKQAALDATDPGGYVKAANNLSRLRIERENVIKLEAQRQEQERREKESNAAEREKDISFVKDQVKHASPTAQRILMNEQAAQAARDAGRGREADLFQRSADQFKRGATPQVQQETAVLEKLVEQNNLLRELRDIWR